MTNVLNNIEGMGLSGTSESPRGIIKMQLPKPYSRTIESTCKITGVYCFLFIRVQFSGIKYNQNVVQPSAFHF